MRDDEPAATAVTIGWSGETRTFDSSDEENWNWPSRSSVRSWEGTTTWSVSTHPIGSQRSVGSKRKLSPRTSTDTCRGWIRVLFGTCARTVAWPVSPAARMRPNESTVIRGSPPATTLKVRGTRSAFWPSSRTARYSSCIDSPRTSTTRSGRMTNPSAGPEPSG
jgi:hypothetical protein